MHYFLIKKEMFSFSKTAEEMLWSLPYTEFSKPDGTWSFNPVEADLREQWHEIIPPQSVSARIPQHSVSSLLQCVCERPDKIRSKEQTPLFIYITCSF